MGAFSGWSLAQRPRLRLIVGGKAGGASERATVVELRAVAAARDAGQANGRQPRRARRPA